MITPSFALTATERVLPNLTLDFTTASLDPRITFTRTTDASNPATYVNSSGHVTAATDNQPRFDYNPVTLACNGLLIEESRSNLLRYSAQFTDASWTKVLNTPTGGLPGSPDGLSNTTSMIETAGAGTGGRYLVSSATAMTSGTTYTGTVYAKAAGRFLQLTFQGATHGTTYWANFNLDTGVVAGSNGSNVAATIRPAGNGWYRCSISAPATTTASGGLVIVLSNVANPEARFPVYTGDGTSGLYIWGAQLETGAFPTSYIPTTTTALTRNADVATMTGTNFSSWWSATTGAATVSVIPNTISGVRPTFGMDDNTANNIISLRGNAANPELYIKATTDQAQIDAGTIVANTAYKLSGAWNTNSCAAAQNGASPVDDTSATIPTVTQARIGSDGTNYANAWIQEIWYWPQRLTNSEVQAFSK